MFIHNSLKYDKYRNINFILNTWLCSCLHGRYN